MLIDGSMTSNCNYNCDNKVENKRLGHQRLELALNGDLLPLVGSDLD
jgi:hypothetical protein